MGDSIRFEPSILKIKPPPIAGTHSLVQRILANKGPFRIDEEGDEDDGLRELRENTRGAYLCSSDNNSGRSSWILYVKQ